MHLHSTDWLIAGAILLFLTAVAWFTKRYIKGVADFLSANRCAGRYVLTTADEVMQMGAVTIIAMFEMFYEAGFSGMWWGNVTMPIFVAVNMTGWVVYRWRQSRVMTQAQFFEVRYSKAFRIFMGIFFFVNGVAGLGLFPAVGANFFIHFCGLPPAFQVGGHVIGTFPTIMLLLVATAVLFTYFGGQITVMVTDFFQGMFCNIIFLALFVLIMFCFDWPQLIAGLSAAPPKASMIHPFQTSEIKSFNMWFYLIAAVQTVILYPTHLSNQNANSSAKNAHEARMAKVLANVRGTVMGAVIVLLAVYAFAVMHNPSFAPVAAKVQASMAGMDKDVARQMTVPVVMAHLLPVGLMGAFLAAMFAAFIGTANQYLLIFSSVFVQDVILPFRKTPFEPKTQLLLLRLGIVLVAVVIFLEGFVIKMNQEIQMFWALLNAMGTGGAAAAVIGGLYWKRGTTTGAWAGVVTGILGGGFGLIIRYIDPNFPINSQWISFITVIAIFVVYFAVSAIEGRLRGLPAFDMDRLLHRGRHAIKEEQAAPAAAGAAPGDAPLSLKGRLYKLLGIGPEFSRLDKATYLFVLGWVGFGLSVFLAGTIYNIFVATSPAGWARFWRVYLWVTFVVGTAVTVWLTVGGLRDLAGLLRALATAKRNVLDNGMVHAGQNLGEPTAEAAPAPAGEAPEKLKVG